jgi:hypothetical protein
MRRAAVLAAAAAIWLATIASGVGQVIANGSFETPDIPSNTFLYDPSGATWVFTGSSGIIDAPGGAFFGQSAPDGSQYAFLQFDPTNAGVFSQTITLSLAGTYQLSYLVAGRPDNGGGAAGDLPYQILLDSTVIASDTTTTGQPFTSKVFGFSATSGSHTLTFETAAGASGDNTAFFDMIAIQAVPEPTVGVLLLSSLSGFLFVRAVKRRCRINIGSARI